VPEFLTGARSPSAENIAAVIFRRLKKVLPKSVRLERVTIGEAHGCSASYVR
jgi:6-pyruvoyl-tetrahydropterin synthase